MNGVRASLGKNGNVLIVEDEFFIADDMAGALTRLGVQVVGPAATIQEARSLAGSSHLDLALLDIHLHGEKIFAFADELASAGVPYVFATGYDTGSIPERFRSIPRWEKPFEVEKSGRRARESPA